MARTSASEKSAMNLLKTAFEKNRGKEMFQKIQATLNRARASSGDFTPHGYFGTTMRSLRIAFANGTAEEKFGEIYRRFENRMNNEKVYDSDKPQLDEFLRFNQYFSRQIMRLNLLQRMDGRPPEEDFVDTASQRVTRCGNQIVFLYWDSPDMLKTANQPYHPNFN